MQPQWHNRLRVIVIIWLIVISLNALAAGYSFMVEPSGAGLRIPLSYLQYSPFRTYFIPGLVLFTTIGLFGMLTAVLAIRKFNFYLQLVLVQGCILMGWIVIQMWLVRDVAWLHVVCGLSGLAWIMIDTKLLMAKRKIRRFDG